MKNEIREFMNRIVRNNEECNYFTMPVEEVKKIITHMYVSKASDSPDAYYYDKNTNTVYIYEHFQFDSSENKRKAGNLLMIEVKKHEKNANNHFNKISTLEDYNGFSEYNEEMEWVSSIEDFKRNFIRNCSNHYDKITNYKNNLVNDLKLSKDVRFKTIFVVENVDTFSTYRIDNNYSKPIVFYPFNVRTLLDYLDSLLDLDYIIYGDTPLGNKRLTIFNKNDIPYLNSKIVEYDVDDKKVEKHPVFFTRFLIPNDEE